MSGSSDLQSLLASLKSCPPPSPAANGQSSQKSSKPSFDPNTFFQSQVSPALASPPITTSSALPRHNMASPMQTVGANGGNDRTQSLLSLLKFSQPSSAGNPPQQHQLQQGPSQSVSNSQTKHENDDDDGDDDDGKSARTSDLMSSLFGSQPTRTTRGGRNTASNPPTPRGLAENTNALTAGKTAEENSQDALLKLLQRSTSSISHQKPEDSREAPDTSFSFDGLPDANLASMKTENQPTKVVWEDSSARTASPIRMFGSNASREATPFDTPATTATKENKPIFTYTNPFEVLHASRNATSQPSGPQTGSSAVNNLFKGHQSNGDKRKPNDAAPPEQASTRRKLTPKGFLSSSASAERVNGRESVFAKLGSVVDQASQEAEKALMEVQIKQEKEDAGAEMDTLAEKLEETVIDAAIQVKKELDKEENQDALEEELSKPVAEAVKDIVNDVAAEAAPADSWETSDEPAEPAPREVPVYNFPLKPFVSITIMDLPPSEVGLREDGVMEISRFKKDFDQVDRTLASATSKYITYAFVKNGGMRVIRQDDGSDRQVFKSSGDRIFHVSLCTTALSAPPTDEQGVLGIGLSGAVYYATISKDGNDLFENDSLDTESLIFPPYPPGDENTMGGALKTRVKRSSRHPEFFAIGRGKSIHIIWPATARSTKYGVNGSNRTVDIEKLYKDRPLKITTGKAGKDFVFSEDDSLMASLDKTGKLRFWDIRKLINESNATALKVQAEDVNMPILSLATASPAEKSWPTSVLFVDKIRPFVKGTALRYILVGLKQNHTLQLWDIGLGKVVQELNFPHDTETDGICSVAYHPNSGIIVVGHPTRNSIFFLHLSAPRYTLQPMSQATYLERIAIKDPDLPKPEATAVISGMREMSFASKGHLRSINLLPVHKPTDAPKEASDAHPLFELYVVHSRGVTCLAIKKEDLGWGPDSKVLHAVDNTVEMGIIKLEKLGLAGSVEEADVNGIAETPQPSKASKKKATKGAADPIPEAPNVKEKLEQFPPIPTTAADSDVPNGVKACDEGHPLSGATPSEKDKKKKKKAGASASLAPSGKGPDPFKSPSRSLSPSKPPTTATDLSTQKLLPTIIDSMAAQPPRAPYTSTSPATATENTSAAMSGDGLEKEIKKLESSVLGEFNKQLDKLYRRLEDDRQVQDAAGSSRQEAVLRLVSASLSTNVENALNRIIGQHMQQVVLPAITNVTAQAIHAQVGETLARILHGLIPHEIGTQLPVAISTAMQNPTHVRSLTENLSKRIVPTMEAHFSELMRTTISPTFQKLAVSAAEQAIGEIEGRIGAKFQQYEIDRQDDAAKMDKLQGSMQGMLEMMAHMTEGQIAFQDKILQDRSSLVQLAESGSRASSRAATVFRSTPLPSRQVSSAQPSPIAPPPKKKSAEEMEIEEIRNLMDTNKYEEGSIRWLQSKRSVELFDEVFVNYTPDYLRHEVSPLVAFSVGVTVANSFENNAQARLDWIYTSLDTVDIRVSPISLSCHDVIANLIHLLTVLVSFAGCGNDEPFGTRACPTKLFDYETRAIVQRKS
jgi:hypothetical protein